MFNPSADENMTNSTKLLLIKTLHTAVWMFFVAVILYLLYCGLVNQLSGLTAVAAGLMVIEGGVLWVFERHCPLTLLARRYSASLQDNFDIFLPNWLARYNQAIFTSIYVISLLLGYRLLQRA